MQAQWWLDTRDKPALLWAFMRHFADRATLSIEGELKDLHLHEIAGAGSEPTEILRRQTTHPIQDFVTIPVTHATLQILQRALSGPGLFNDCGAIIHVQVEHEGTLVLGAYDNFHRHCVVANPPTPVSLLDELHQTGILRAYRDVPPPH